MSASRQLLTALDVWRVFESMPLPGHRTPLYVPFETLSDADCEKHLAKAVADIRRTVVVAPIGAGKSSLIEYVLGLDDRAFAPLWVSAGHEGRDALTDPTEFARHVIRQIVRWADDVDAMTAEEQHAALVSTALRYGTGSISSSQSLGVKLAAKWIIEPSWACEVVNTLADPDNDRSRFDFLDSLGRLVELIYTWGKTPVLIIDDFDVWVNTAAPGDVAAVDAFFDVTCRKLSELNWALVVCVHPELCGLASFRAARGQGYFNEQIELPRLGRDALRRILDERIRYAAESADEEARAEGIDLVLGGAGFDDVFEPGCLELLVGGYERGSANLRPVLRIAEAALRSSVAAGEASIGMALLRDAMLNS